MVVPQIVQVEQVAQAVALPQLVGEPDLAAPLVVVEVVRLQVQGAQAVPVAEAIKVEAQVPPQPAVMAEIFSHSRTGLAVAVAVVATTVAVAVAVQILQAAVAVAVAVQLTSTLLRHRSRKLRVAAQLPEAAPTRITYPQLVMEAQQVLEAAVDA